MNGQDILFRLKRLNEIQDAKEIRQLTAALFPGSHCPLMGAMMAIGGIEDAIMLVLGTDECTYYTKKATIGGFSFHGIDNRCFSVVLNQHDVTFGCKNKLYHAFDELVKEISPKLVFLVTTCVMEVTGDDVDSMAMELNDKYQIPVLPGHTEHFKTENHLPGVRDTISACIPVMKTGLPVQPNRINVIGQRLGSFRETETFHLLTQHGIEIGMMLPGGTSLEAIQTAPAAKVNIVVHELGLPLAMKMQELFGTPYVMFEKYASPERILASYQELAGYLQLDLTTELEVKYNACTEQITAAKAELSGMKYIYGNTALACYEYNAFLVSLGMEPQLIQTNEFPGQDNEFVQAILEKYNPYVTKTANITPLQYVYDELKPNLYFGHEYATRLRAKGIALVHDSNLSSRLGFEVTEAVVTELRRAAAEAKELIARRVS